MAVDRFLCCERSPSEWTAMPGRDVRDAHRRLGLVDVLAARAARAHDVDAQVLLVDLDLDGLVDVRVDEDAGERGVAARVARRTARCAPAGARPPRRAASRRPTRPSTPMVALLMPASSPGCRSSSSSLKPLRSAQRAYMRSSISAQSCDSVPPAPALMLTSAPLPVVRPRQHARELHLADGLLDRRSASPPASTAVASSLASSASSMSTPASSSALLCASKPSTVDLSRACSRSTACALSAAFQNSAAPRLLVELRYAPLFAVDVKDAPGESRVGSAASTGVLSGGRYFHAGVGAENSTSGATCARPRSKCCGACTRSSGRTWPGATAWRSPCSGARASRSRRQDGATKPRSTLEIASRSGGCRPEMPAAGWNLSWSAIPRAPHRIVPGRRRRRHLAAVRSGALAADAALARTAPAMPDEPLAISPAHASAPSVDRIERTHVPTRGDSALSVNVRANSDTAVCARAAADGRQLRRYAAKSERAPGRGA